jgi:uncharacterized membrane protein YciS (DUF1049 family)
MLGVALFVGTLWTGWSFRARNAEPIDLDLIWIRISDIELWWVILVSIGIGAAVTGVLVGFGWMRIRLVNYRYRRAIRRLESELHEMRSLPLAGAEGELREAPLAMPAVEQR